ncbi:MAG TPA: biotin--[acetyl-CoA-carboxylase] ligase [Burkholderiales bacterium]|jgi:BirA family biotin operon repressor/biotin-[acetyl-CoA-carboxylase] ligase
MTIPAMALPGVEVRRVARCGSTNSVLLAQAPAAPVLLVADEQTAGRGRRGRRWIGAPGASLSFSLARRLRRPLRELAALSLVAGVAAARALRALGAPAELKWPNDLVASGGKLGGILVETRAAGRETLAVVGIGINLRGADELSRRLRRPVASLDRFVAVGDGDFILQKIAAALMSAVDAFEAEGFEPARRDWEAMHAHAGQRVKVRLANGRSVTGVATGLGEDGALSLRTRSGIRSIRSGTVRAA